MFIPKLISSLRLNETQQHWLEFLYVMTVREIKARYKHAVLGFLWVFLNPLLQMLIMGFVFRFFVPVNVDNYFLFLFTGLLPWMFFSLSLTKGTPSIFHERSLIKKANFPREAIILSIVFSNLFHLIVSLLLLSTILIADKVIIENFSTAQLLLYLSQFIWLPIFSFWILLFTVGLTFLSSALNVKYRDVNFVVQAFLPLWFYATPILYRLELLPTWTHIYFYLNPMTAIIEGFQFVFLNIKPTDYNLWMISLIISLVVFYCGVLLFNSEKKWFDDWL